MFGAGGKKVAFNTPQRLAALTLLADVAQRAHLPLVAPPGQGAIDLNTFQPAETPRFTGTPR